MRYLGTLMLLAGVGMLLFPSLWEGRGPFSAGISGGEAPFAAPGRSTLEPSDLLPPWRGPVRAPRNDG